MTIADTILELNDALQDAKTAITTAGGTVGDTGLAGLATEIATIPSGGGSEDPDDWGFVEYYDQFAYNAQRIQGEECTVELVDSGKLAQAVLNGGGDGRWLDFSFESGNGWMCFEIDHQRYFTTAELLSELGISVTDFDESSADWASIMIQGEVAPDITAGSKKLVLQSESEYLSLSYSAQTHIVPLAGIVRFVFGRAVTSVPDYFLYNAKMVKTIDTTYANAVTSIGNSAFSQLTLKDNDMTFESVTTVGNYVFQDTYWNGKLYLPNVVTVGDRCFGSFGSQSFLQQPYMPKVETIGEVFLAGFRGQEFAITDYPKIRTIGRQALIEADIQRLVLDRGDSCPDLQSIGAGLCMNCYSLGGIECSADIIGCIEQDVQIYVSFGFRMDISSYMDGGCYRGGLFFHAQGGDDPASVMRSRFPTVSENSQYRKWYNL
ncbi:MAG: leucine-rich repeat protein [Methanobrevibacter sp.]|nr:leucine-rich repeat protein [Methanobrevibacter sp.]